MDNKRTAIERAFDLAKSGACASVSDIKHCLKLEGYSMTSIEGPALNKQLRGLILEAQGPTMPKAPKRVKRPADVIGNAAKVMPRTTGEEEETVVDDGKDKAAQSLGRRGARHEPQA